MVMFDFETTTKFPDSAEILTAYFKTVGEKPDELYIEMKPDKYHEDSYAIHGITETQTMSFPPKLDGFRKIYSYMKRNTGEYWCHANNSVYGIAGYFDVQVLKMQTHYLNLDDHFKPVFNNIEFKSTHTLAKQKKIPVKNYKLETLAEFFQYEYNAHDCIEDVKAMEYIYNKIINYKNLLDLMGI